jgi:putative colanic acid biosynthesis UDP-glucose lipid carrier transferase
MESKLNRRFSVLIRPIIFFGDLVILNGVFLILYIRNHFIIATYNRSWYLFLLLLNLVWLIIIFYTNPYQVTRVFQLRKILKDTSYAIVQHFFVTVALIFFLHFELVNSFGLPISYLILLLTVIFWRIIFYYFLKKYRLRGYNYRNAVVVGYGTISKNIEHFFLKHPEFGYRFIGYFDDLHTGKKIIGSISEIEEYVKKNNIDEIYCCLPYVKYAMVRKIVDLAESSLIKVKVVSDYRAFSLKNLELERYDEIPILNISSLPLDNRRNQVVKRLFDICFSSAFILFIAIWLFPIIGILIKMDSKGPVFFLQKRTGRNNQSFWCYKFRTMIVNIESDTTQATKGDTRITKLGAFLRKSSIDELPQFFNVFQGEMSVVGPRPHMLKHTEQYAQVVIKFMARHFVKPGITGLAQSKGYRGETKDIADMKNRVRLDRFYVENWSFLLDVKIIIETVISIFIKNNKAY